MFPFLSVPFPVASSFANRFPSMETSFLSCHFSCPSYSSFSNFCPLTSFSSWPSSNADGLTELAELYRSYVNEHMHGLHPALMTLLSLLSLLSLRLDSDSEVESVSVDDGLCFLLLRPFLTFFSFFPLLSSTAWKSELITVSSSSVTFSWSQTRNKVKAWQDTDKG